jgi:signal transduction histidine kinase
MRRIFTGQRPTRPRDPWGMWPVIFVLLLAASTVTSESLRPADPISIADLQARVDERGRAIASFETEGTVVATLPERNAVILQDASAAALIELPSLDRDIQPGEDLVITGSHCALTRGPLGIQVAAGPVVNNDGVHTPLTLSGSVYLEPGQRPIRVEWFNRSASAVLNAEYEGPGVRRQRIPAHSLFHSSPGNSGNRYEKGLLFAAYSGWNGYALPDFSTLTPSTTGIATNIGPGYAGDGPGALIFQGFLKISQPGIYRFYLESADGSRLDAGNPGDYCQVIRTGEISTVNVTNFEAIVGRPGVPQWAEVEGTVNFAGLSENSVLLEIAARAAKVQATVIGQSVAALTNLFHRQVRIRGIYEASAEGGRDSLLVPGAEMIEVVENQAQTGPLEPVSTLIAASQVQRLNPAQAGQHQPVKIKGVVTQAAPVSLVLQDATGGVFVHYTPQDWTGHPRIGDVWQVEGWTDPGDFSPVVVATNAVFLGRGTMPEPVRPSWDQLLNGSLDAQYVEVRGVITAMSGTDLTLLTADGKARIIMEEQRSSYADGSELFVGTHQGVVPVDQVQKSYLGAVVRIRGCVVAVWDPDGQVNAGEIRMVAAVVNVEEPRPADPFLLETVKASSIRLFNPHANALLRTKVAGQVVYARARECFIQDGKAGIRAVPEVRTNLNSGDWVEAVGYPQLGGGAPVLQDAQIRITGRSNLPPATLVASTNLPDHKLDATLVRVDAMLLGDTENMAQRILELQAGSRHFLARLVWPYGEPLSVGSRVRVTGVYATVPDEQVNGSLDPFELLLNRPADVVVLRRPPWWTVQHALIVIATLVIGLGIATVWISLLRRRVEERTAQLKIEIEERQMAQQQRIIDQERTRVAQDLHDELGAGLTEVSILGSLAKTPEIPAEARDRYVEQLTNVARSLVTALDEIVWAVNPQYDTVSSVAEYHSLFAQRFLNLAGIACRLQVSESLPEYTLDSRARHSVFLAFKEALNNVVRHSGATEVHLVIEVSAAGLVLAISDNGRGFDSTALAPGADGLAGMARRMQSLSGSCQVTSRPGAGTTVRLHLPLTTRRPQSPLHDQDRHR